MYKLPKTMLLYSCFKGFYHENCFLLYYRHGRGHTIMPTNVNFRANIWAMKELGCTHLLVTTACGSLQEGMHPGDIVVIDQFIDR